MYVCLSAQFFDSGAETSELISTKLGSFYLPLMPFRIMHKILQTPPGGGDIKEKRKLGGKTQFTPRA
jgi:hypothetical protein